MPLLRFDLIEGRTDAELQTLLDAAHRAMLAAFKVPEGDRYQIVNEHKPSRMIVEDTGLDIPRTKDVIVVTVVTRPRGKKAKQKFYRLLVDELQRFHELVRTRGGHVVDGQMLPGEFLLGQHPLIERRFR